MPTTLTAATVEVYDKLPCEGGTLQGTVASVENGAPVKLVLRTTSEDLFTITLPADDPAAVAAKIGRYFVVTLTNGQVFDMRITTEQANDQDSVATVAYTCCGIMEDLAKRVPLVNTQSTTIEGRTSGGLEGDSSAFWTMFVDPSLLEAGIAWLALGTYPATKFSWDFKQTHMVAAYRAFPVAVGGFELEFVRNGTSGYTMNVVSQRGATAPTVTFDIDDNLTQAGRNVDDTLQVTSVRPLGDAINAQPSTAAPTSYRITVAVSGTLTVTLADPDGTYLPVRTAHEYDGLVLVRLATGEHFLVDSCDPNTQQVVLDASTGWPADGFTAGSTTGELVTFVGTLPAAPSNTNRPADSDAGWRQIPYRSVYNGATPYHKTGMDFEVTAINTGTKQITIALNADWTGIATSSLAAACGGNNAPAGRLALRNRTLEFASLVAACTGTTTWVDNGQITSTGWPGTEAIGDFVVPAPNTTATTFRLTSLPAGPNYAYATQLYASDPDGIGGGPIAMDNNTIPVKAKVFRKTTSVAYVVAVISDTVLQLNDVTGISVGDRLVFGKRPWGDPLLRASVSASGVVDRYATFKDVVGERNEIGNGDFGLMSGALPVGWGQVTGTATLASAPDVKFKNAFSTTGIVRSNRVRLEAGPSTTALSASLWLKSPPNQTSGNLYVNVLDVTGLPDNTAAPRIIATLQITSTTAQPFWSGVYQAVDLIQIPLTPYVRDIIIEIDPTDAPNSGANPVGTPFFVGGAMLLTYPVVTVPMAGLVPWSGANALRSKGQDLIALRSDPRLASGNFTAQLYDLYRFDTSNTSQELFVGQTIDYNNSRLGISHASLRLMELEMDLSDYLSTKVTLGRLDTRLEDMLAAGLEGGGGGGGVSVGTAGAASLEAVDPEFHGADASGNNASAAYNTSVLQAILSTRRALWIRPDAIYATHKLTMLGSGVTNPSQAVNIWGGGTLKLADSQNTELLWLQDCYWSIIKDIILDGNRANQTLGSAVAFLLRNQAYSQIRGVRVLNSAAHGIAVENYDAVTASSMADELNFTDCFILFAYNNGLYFRAVNPAGQGPGDLTVQGCHVNANGGHGMRADAGAFIKVTGGEYLTNALSGLVFSYGINAVLNGLTTRNNGDHGVWAQNHDDLTAAAVTSHFNNLNAGSGVGFLLDTCADALIGANCKVHDRGFTLRTYRPLKAISCSNLMMRSAKFAIGTAGSGGGSTGPAGLDLDATTIASPYTSRDCVGIADF